MRSQAAWALAFAAFRIIGSLDTSVPTSSLFDAVVRVDFVSWVLDQGGVMPANVFEWDGWQGQFQRAHRWHDRFLRVANDWESYGLDEQIDYALVFFQNAYHVRDYLLHENVVTQKALDDLMNEARPLRIARDLANGSKHRMLTNPSVDASPWIHRSLNFGGPRLTLKMDPDLLDLVVVASSCIDVWLAFFRTEGLDPSSNSPPRQALLDAVAKRSPPTAAPA